MTDLIPGVVYDSADELFQTAELVFEHILNVFQQYSTPLPDRQFITMGTAEDTVHDCEQVSLSISQVYSGLPGAQMNEPKPCFDNYTAVMVVSIVRCIPTPSGRATTAPAADAITRTAFTQSRDAMLLLQGASDALEAQQFLMGGGVADVMVGKPTGNMQAVTLNLALPVYKGPIN